MEQDGSTTSTAIAEERMEESTAITQERMEESDIYSGRKDSESSSDDSPWNYRYPPEYYREWDGQHVMEWNEIPYSDPPSSAASSSSSLRYLRKGDAYTRRIRSMAELVVDGALRALCSALVTPTTINFIDPQLSLGDKVRNELLDIARDLESIQSVLQDADRKMETNDDPMLRDWVEDVRDVAYNIEDIVESHMYNLSKRGGILNIKTVQIFMTSRKTAEKLERIKPRVEKILKIHDDLICKKISPSPKWEEGSSSAAKSELPKFSPTEYRYEDLQDGFFTLDERGVIQQKKILEEWILQQPSWISTANDNNVLFDPKSMCIAVWGMRGLGKTTLLEQIFYRNANIRQQFHRLAWITVSKTFEITCLLKELLKKLAEPTEIGVDNKSKEEIIDMIHRIVDKKRYLIVFDDVWEDEFWRKIRMVFRSSDDRRSRILFTTRDENVARTVARKDRVMQLSHLNAEQAWSLFCQKVFGEEDPPSRCPRKLESCAKTIVKKCGGVPLAIVTVAGMRFTKGRDVWDWERNCNILSTKLGGESELSSILMHNYYDLPPHLKRCFLYCCDWPEDWIFPAHFIIPLWVAEGFIEESDGSMTLEEMGEVYIEELVSRSMMIRMVHSDKLDPYYYKVHDFLRVIGLDVSQGQKFAAIVDEDRQNYPSDARRLHICKSIDDEIPKLRKLRTLVVSGIDELKISLGNCKLLKVLYLKGIRMSNVPREIFQLFNLRYLNLRGTGIEEEIFPSEIDRLQNLQVLDISETWVKRLPRSIGKLKKLRMLHCGSTDGRGGAQVPVEICDLKDLQFLRYIEVNGGGDLMEQLGNLTQLRYLSIVELKHSHEKQKLCSSLKRMAHLKSLCIRTKTAFWDDDDDEEPIDLESLKHEHPRHLEVIFLGCAIKGGIPTWFKSLQSLRYLGLRNSKLQEGGGDIFENFKHLPCLEFLGLGEDAFEGTKLSFPSPPCFPRLKQLLIYDLIYLTSIEVEDSALPNLRRITINSCCNLIPPKVAEVEKLLERLEEIILRNMPPHLVRHFQEMCTDSSVKLTIW